MFSILINYTDFFDLELLQTIDEFFLNYSISKQPLQLIVDKILQTSILILFLPYCNNKAFKILNFLSESKKAPRFVFCLSKKHSQPLEDICQKNSYYYFTPKSFTNKFINALIKIKNSTSSHILHHKNLILNTLTRKCQRGESTFILTNQEFYLLKYLLENRERPLSKAELLDAVWGYKSTITTRSLDVYISRLRLKIDDKFDTKYIKTIHCYGYVMS